MPRNALRSNKHHVPFSNDQIREIILRYLYTRNANAKSLRGSKSGVAVKISIMRKELKESHGLKQTDIWSNLTYLISQGWVEVQTLERSVPTPQGRLIPSTTSYYIITAAGVDKIEGPGRFTMDKFHEIRIEAAGQNVITVGDGNQVNARFGEIGQALAELKDDLRSSGDVDEQTKAELIGDIDSIQSQLAKPQPNKSVVSTLWSGIEKAAKLAGLGEQALKIAHMLGVLQ